MENRLVRVVANMSYAPYGGGATRPKSNAGCVAGTLWQGARPNRNVGVNTLVLCAKEFQPDVEHFPYVREIIYCGIDDSYLLPEEGQTAIEAAFEVVKRLKTRRTVLVTCEMGLNRSGLVAALAAMKAYKLTVAEAVAAVRKARKTSSALSNSDFCMFLYNAEKSGWADS